MKAIRIPCSGAVEIGDYLPIIDSAEFQRLRQCRQLGLNDLVFPGAQHTRFEHALGVFQRTQLAAQLQHFDDERRRHLEAFALLHDIGHGPFSHQLEPILDGDHHSRGLELLEKLTPRLKRCGVDAQVLSAMLAGTEPLGFWVSDRNLGTDKLDYLQRDAFHIGFTGVPDLELLQRQTKLTSEGIIAINEKFIEEGKRLQKFYSYIHQHGYLNKTALTAQRMLQRAVHEELLLSDDPAELSRKLWAMTDGQLMGWLTKPKSKLAQQLTTQLTARVLPRTCICIKPEGYAYVENAVGKSIALIEWPRARLARFSSAMAKLEHLRDKEDQLCAAAGLPAGSVLLAAMPYFTKLLPRDLRIANGGEQDYWLFEKDRDHKASLESDYLRTFAIRIVVQPEHRERIAKAPEAIIQCLDK